MLLRDVSERSVYFSSVCLRCCEVGNSRQMGGSSAAEVNLNVSLSVS